jgi:hypothetical protein
MVATRGVVDGCHLDGGGRKRRDSSCSISINMTWTGAVGWAGGGGALGGCGGLSSWMNQQRSLGARMTGQGLGCGDADAGGMFTMTAAEMGCAWYQCDERFTLG